MTYHLARDLAPNDSIAWLSTPTTDLATLTRLADEAERRTLRAALSRGRASTEYAAAAAEQTAADATLSLAQSRVDSTIGSIPADAILKVGSEYVTVRSSSTDTVEVGRAAFGSTRSTHSAGATVYQVDVRVEATFDLELLIDGGGVPLTTGDKGDIVIPFAGRISSVKLISDQPGDVVIDILSSAFPATPSVSIVGTTLPFLAGSTTYSDDVLAAWDLACAEDDVLRVLVVSAATITRLTVVVTYTTTQA